MKSMIRCKKTTLLVPLTWVSTMIWRVERHHPEEMLQDRQWMETDSNLTCRRTTQPLKLKMFQRALLVLTVILKQQQLRQVTKTSTRWEHKNCSSQRTVKRSKETYQKHSRKCWLQTKEELMLIPNYGLILMSSETEMIQLSMKEVATSRTKTLKHNFQRSRVSLLKRRRTSSSWWRAKCTEKISMVRTTCFQNQKMKH